METYDQKRMRIWVVVAPVLLLCVMGTIRYVIASKSLSLDKTTPIAAQSTSRLETETIEHTEPRDAPTKQPATETESEEKPNLSEELVPPTQEQDTSPPPTEPSQPTNTTPKQDTKTTPIPTPKPVTPSVPSEPVLHKQQTTTESEEKSTPSREPAPAIEQQETAPTTPSEPAPVAPKQETRTLKPAIPPAGMVLIPAGEFQMGSNDNTDEKPVHTVYIDAFYIDAYEVTNAQYKVSVDANAQWRKDQIQPAYHDGGYLKHWTGNNYPSGKGEHPVTYVSWYGAIAYALSIFGEGIVKLRGHIAAC